MWCESGHAEVQSERMEGPVTGRLEKINDELYNCFVDRLHTGQLASIPYRAIR